MAEVLRTEWETPENCPKCGEHLAVEWAYCPLCGRPTNMAVIDTEGSEEPPQMYIEYRNGVPVAYRYSPEWVAMQLYMEGGYKTPEEAKEAWLRERTGE